METKEKIQEAIDAAYTAFFAKLNELGVNYDDCDTATYFDDAEEKKTYYVRNVVIEECPEYGGDAN